MADQHRRGPTWGIVSTIKAGTQDILDFAAHHLELGAHRLYIFLDDPDPQTITALKPHPKVRVIACDEAHWAKRGKRPDAHQSRQTQNATRAYRRPAEVDWLAHIDGDEFLWPETSVAEALASLPPDIHVARVRPLEALAPTEPDPHAPAVCFKGMPILHEARGTVTSALYPEFAALIDDGFLSHVAGKLLVRTGLPGPRFRIHNFSSDGEKNPGQVELESVPLLHVHSDSWEAWRARFDYRHAHGAYRASLERKGPTGLNLHEFFSALIESEGEAGLRRFYETLFKATPQHCAALHELGLLRIEDLGLAAKRSRHFPQWAGADRK